MALRHTGTLREALWARFYACASPCPATKEFSEAHAFFNKACDLLGV